MNQKQDQDSRIAETMPKCTVEGARTPIATTPRDADFEHPAAKRMREKFEAKYQDMHPVASAIRVYFNTRTDFDSVMNRGRQTPVSQEDVEAAEQRVFAAVRARDANCGANNLLPSSAIAGVDAAEAFAFASTNGPSHLLRHWFRRGFLVGADDRNIRGLSEGVFRALWDQSGFDDGTEETVQQGLALLRCIESALGISMAQADVP